MEIMLDIFKFNKMGKAMGVVEWITASNLASDDLKAATKKMMDDAIAIDPEMGLDADPVFDAQDFPTEGFELDSFDEKTNRLIVKGKEWQDFKVTIKLKDENGIRLVDGCGGLNSPKNADTKNF